MLDDNKMGESWKSSKIWMKKMKKTLKFKNKLQNNMW